MRVRDGAEPRHRFNKGSFRSFKKHKEKGEELIIPEKPAKKGKKKKLKKKKENNFFFKLKKRKRKEQKSRLDILAKYIQVKIHEAPGRFL